MSRCADAHTRAHTPPRTTPHLDQIAFQPLPPASIDALITEGEIFYCAGGLMVEHALVAPHVTSMAGGLDSVMGLPKDLTVRLLMNAAAAAADA